MGPARDGEGTPKAGWLRRPRASLWERAPKYRVFQAVWAFPYICLGLLIWHILGGPPLSDIPFMVVLSAVAIIETVFVLAWLRRPVRTNSLDRSAVDGDLTCPTFPDT